MNLASKLVILASLGMLLSGCATVDNAVKSPPGGVYSGLLYADDTTLDRGIPPPKSTTQSNALYEIEGVDWLLPLVELGENGFIYRHTSDRTVVHDKDKPPVYLAYDLSRLKRDRFDLVFTTDTDAAAARNILVLKVLDQADRNFNTYYSRIMGYDRGTDMVTRSVNTLATGAAGGTALITGPGAAGIATASVIGNATESNFKQSFLGGGTVKSIVTAMGAARQKFEVTMLNKLYVPGGGIASISSYSIEQVLADFAQLDSIASLDGALDYIAQTSQTDSQTAKANASAIVTGQKPVTPAKPAAGGT